MCSNKEALFSKAEIISRATNISKGFDFELHRPWIDRIQIKCFKCGTIMLREPFVLDTWHNSGAAPYASLNNDEFMRLVPAAFMTEGIDQTRGTRRGGIELGDKRVLGPAPIVWLVGPGSGRKIIGAG